MITLKKLLILISLLMFTFLCTSILFYAMMSAAPDWINTIWGKITLQTLQTIIIFGITPLLGIKILEKKEPIKAMALNKKVPSNKILIVFFFAIAALPGITWLADLNAKMQLPSFMSGIESWMRNLEESSRILTEEFINTSSPLRLLINILVMAILPAICEEMMFRGWLQRSLHKYISAHTAIWLSAFIFSAIHFQFYGFIPRLIIGACLGYIYYYTKSLWGPILAHFINNFAAVVTGYLTYNNIIDIDSDMIGTGNMWPIAIGSIALSAILIIKLQDNKQ